MEQGRLTNIIDTVKKSNTYLAHNKQIFDILEGDLMKYLAIDIMNQLSPSSAEIALTRACPVNILRKMTQKLSKLYMDPPTRTTDLPVDQELIDYYVDSGLDSHMNDVNEFFNSMKAGLLEIYEYNGEIKFRSVPGHMYLPISDDPIDPLRMTALVRIIPRSDDTKFWIYTDSEFIAVDDKGNLVYEDMDGNGGINPFGVIPFVYVQRSRYLLVPQPDTDLVKMSLLIPTLLTDMNFGSMFNSHPIVYGVDVDSDNLQRSPNVFWSFKSSQETDKQPQVNVLQPDPKLSEQMANAIDQLSMWMQTRNIRPGVIGGKIDSQNFASGVSLIIQEMDTTEDRRIQAIYFQDAEADLWHKTATIHNVLASVGRLDNRKLFSDPEKLKVSVEFADQKPPEDRLLKVDRLDKEIKAGLITKEMAIKENRPSLSEDQIQEILNSNDNSIIGAFSGITATESNDKDQSKVRT